MIAVIDIGSNSVRLMLWADGKTILKRILTTRLGAGVQNRCLDPAAMLRSAEAVASFYNEAKEAGACQVYAFATAAVRSAENKEEFLRLVKEKCPLDIDVVAGEREASLAALGALKKEDGIVIDVGGASSEVVCIKNGARSYAKSFSVGAVTLREHCKDDEAATEQYLSELFSGLAPMEGKVYAVGGTATALACLTLELKEYDAERVQNCYLSQAELSKLKSKLFSLKVEERKKLVGMEAARADVIAGGAAIIAKIADKIGAEGIYTSDCDNLEGYLYERGLIEV